MAFKRDKEALPEYDVLDINTKYRFAEIELSYAIPRLAHIYRMASNPRQSATLAIFRTIAPPAMQFEEVEDAFMQATNGVKFRNPDKDELIDYFKFRRLSYAKIRHYTNTSPNTIRNRMYIYPTLFPHFQRWNESMLEAWETASKTINIFNEDLVHSSWN